MSGAVESSCSFVHNRNFYSDPDAELYTFNGFLVLAVDGSDINIPTTPETIAMFGDAAVRGGKPCAQIGLGCLYDALNRMILDASCNRVKFNEMASKQSVVQLPGNSIRYIFTSDNKELVLPERENIAKLYDLLREKAAALEKSKF